jgi:hypothetical protein
VIERAGGWVPLDGWTDHFDFQKWMEAFRLEGVSVEPTFRSSRFASLTSPAPRWSSFRGTTLTLL